MNNFTYYNPTKLIFGEGTIAEIGPEIPLDAKILITYGGSSAKRFGTLDEVKKALGNRVCIEFPGIEPNPEYTTLMRAVNIVKENNIDYILAVGGGSVIDGTKFIAAAARYSGNVWQMWSEQRPINDAVPYGCVLTIPATGSEMNSGAVISHHEQKIKISHRSPLLFPRFSVLDPTKSYTLPKRQVANGIIDAFIHVIEQYLTYPVYGKVQDRMAEGLLLTLIEEGPKAMVEPENYDVRATIMLSATLALNGLISVGVPQDWATHRIGHQITALYGLDHAQTLAIVLPALLHIEQEEKQTKLLQYAKRVWNIVDEEDDEMTINAAIRCTREFFESLGVPCQLSAYNLPESCIDEIIDSMVENQMLPIGEHSDIDELKLRRILSLAY